jgi:hypothetical protein
LRLEGEVVWEVVLVNMVMGMGQLASGSSLKLQIAEPNHWLSKGQLMAKAENEPEACCNIPLGQVAGLPSNLAQR